MIDLPFIIALVFVAGFFVLVVYIKKRERINLKMRLDDFMFNWIMVVYLWFQPVDLLLRKLAIFAVEEGE